MHSSAIHRKPEPGVSALLRRRIDAADFPSAVYVIAEHGQVVFADALGDATRQPQHYPASLETIYDLASLTKPMITGLLCAIFAERGGLNVGDRVAEHLPDFDRDDKRHITVKQLLTHTSGLPAWRPLYVFAKDKVDALTSIANEPLESAPDDRVIYSDLGFIVLGFLLQKITALSLVELSRREIIEPLELQHTFFNPSAAAQTGVAACETGNAYERDMCERDYAGHLYDGWRVGTIWGEVHDGNAHFLGGVAGHAGLFSNANETLRLANQFVGESSQLLTPDTCKLFRQNMTERLNEARSFAWQLAATKDSTAGPSLAPDAFGHTGFTGTSCWVEAERQRVFILLTNRTHARQIPFANINGVRREFHSLAVRALDEREIP